MQSYRYLMVYSMWKKRVTLFLKLKKCYLAIESVKSNTGKEDWDENDLKAINYIYSAILNKLLEFMCNKTTAYEIIKIVYRNKLESLKLKDYNKSATFFCEFEKRVNELKNVGVCLKRKNVIIC